MADLIKVGITPGPNPEILYFQPAPNIKIGKKVKKDTYLGSYSFNNNSLSKKILSPASGELKFIFNQGEHKLTTEQSSTFLAQEAYVFLIEECSHSIIFNEICSECLEPRPHHQSFKLNHNEKVTVDAKFIKQKIDTFLDNRKLIVLLDLDNTILHSQQASPSTIFEFMSKNKDQNVKHLILDNSCNLIVKIRPNFIEFGKKLNESFEVYVYTFGTRSYAEKVIQLVDPDEIVLKVLLKERQVNNA